MDTLTLKDRAKARGMTIEQLATKAGISRGVVYHWMSGRQRPNYTSLAKLSKGLKVSVSTLAKDFGM